MGYYIGGDREDDGNYTPSGTHKKAIKQDNARLEQLLDEQPQIFKGFDLPKEFDPDYYFGKQKKYGKFSPDYWEWAKLNKYSQAVFAFLRQATNQFYKTFAPQTAQLSKFETDCLTLKAEDLDELAEGVKNAEKNLITQFARDGREISSKIKRYPALFRLTESGAKAWVMYAAINKKLNVKDAINFKTAYESFNLNSELDQLKTYRGVAIMKYKLQAINDGLQTRVLNLPKEIYFGVDTMAILNNLLEKVNGFKTYDYDELLENIDLENLTQKYPDLMQIYSNYGYILNLIKLINQNSRRIKERGLDNEINTDWLDHYRAGENVNNLILQLLKGNLDKRFVGDLQHLNSCLEEALTGAKQVYEKSGLKI